MSIPIRTVKTDGFTMDYFCFGQGEKTMVVIPGLSALRVTASADAVAEQYQLLTKDFTIYVFDPRNELPETYPLSSMASDTADAIKALGLSDIYLFGVSKGGMASMEIAAEHPELVKKLLVGSAGAKVEESQKRLFEKWSSWAREGKAMELFLDFGEMLYPKEVFEAARGFLEEGAKAISQEELERFAVLAEGIDDFDISRFEKRISCPAFVIGDKTDRIFPEDSFTDLYDHLKEYTDCSIYMYDGFGHAVYDVAPDYREKIQEFFL